MQQLQAAFVESWRETTDNMLGRDGLVFRRAHDERQAAGRERQRYYFIGVEESVPVDFMVSPLPTATPSFSAVCESRTPVSGKLFAF